MYGTSNKYYSKTAYEKYLANYLMPRSIIFALTEEADYQGKRKALGKAFSASKLKDITKCVKEITLKEIKAF